MKIPSLRRPVGASVLAGICGAGLIDLLLTAGHRGATGVLALTLGFYGTAAILCGLGAELVSLVCEKAFYHLEAPPIRVTGFDTPFPYALELEYLPLSHRIVPAILEAARV